MVTVICAVICAVTGVAAAFFVRKRWRFTDTPTSEAAHVFPGLGEVAGTVEAIGDPIAAPGDGVGCVWWQYQVEREHTETKTTRNADGTTSTSTTTTWVTEEAGGAAQPFQLRDDSGVVRVVLDESVSVARAHSNDVEHLSLNMLRSCAQVMRQTYEPGMVAKALGGIFGSNSPDEPIAHFGGTWRATERRLQVGDEVFITAVARITESGSEVELAPTDLHGKHHTFEITIGNEKNAMGARASLWLIGALAVVCVGTGAAAGFTGGKGAGLALALLVLAAAAVGVWVVGAFNRVHRARGRCEFAWSLIDVACEQRATVVGGLQTVVDAAMENERAVLERIATARHLGRAPTVASAAAVSDASAASVELVARVEALPTLTSQPNVAQMIGQLRLLNDRVAFARRFYNDSVTRLQNRLTQFPDSLIGKVARVNAIPLLEA